MSGSSSAKKPARAPERRDPWRFRLAPRRIAPSPYSPQFAADLNVVVYGERGQAGVLGYASRSGPGSAVANASGSSSRSVQRRSPPFSPRLSTASSGANSASAWRQRPQGATGSAALAVSARRLAAPAGGHGGHQRHAFGADRGAERTVLNVAAAEHAPVCRFEARRPRESPSRARRRGRATPAPAARAHPRR